MTEYQLDQICSRNPDCGCNCMKCQVYAMYMRSELGMDEEPEDDEYYEEDAIGGDWQG